MAIEYPPYRLDIDYPDSDGQLMGESSLHIDAMIYLSITLRDFFRNAADVYVGCNQIFYYQEGNPHASVAPDVFVVRGVNKASRGNYKLWQEGREPSVVFEITSLITKIHDPARSEVFMRRLAYKSISCMTRCTNTFRLPSKVLNSSALTMVASLQHPTVRLHSRQLNVDLQIVDDQLRVIDSQTGEIFKTPLESFEAVRQAKAARLRAELEELRRKQG